MEEKRYHSQEGRPSMRGWLITGNYTFRLVTACVLSYCDSTCCNDPHLSLSLSIQDNDQVSAEDKTLTKSIYCHDPPPSL